MYQYRPTILVLWSVLRLIRSCPASCSCPNTAPSTTTTTTTPTYSTLVPSTTTRYLVNCSSRELGLLPPDIPHNTTILDLSHNRLRDESWEQLLLEVQQLKHLRQLLLSDNIFTSTPQLSDTINFKIDLTDNPLHCTCATLLISPNNYLHYDKVKCSTTTNPEVRSTYLSKLSPDHLQCEESELVVPAKITLYKLILEQTIPCRKTGNGTVYWTIRDVVVYQTTQQDCSFVIKYLTSRDTGRYQVRYETAFENKTSNILVLMEKESSEPKIDDSAPLVEVQHRGTAKLSCAAIGAPPPTIDWFLDNRDVREIADGHVILVNEATLIVTDITEERIFTCRATNQLGWNEAKFVVKPVQEDGSVLEWIAPISITLLVVLGTGSVAYIIYTKQKLRQLKQRCSSPGLSSSGTIFENCDAAPSVITQCADGFKMLAISTISPPHQLICPITRECMKNPVVASDGFSYEEKAILAWFKRNGTSPMTNGEISKRLIQNHNLRTLIRDLMDKTSISDSFINLDKFPPTPSPRSSPSTSPSGAPSHSANARVGVVPSHSANARVGVVPSTTVLPNQSEQLSPAELSNVSTDRSRISSAISSSPSAGHSEQYRPGASFVERSPSAGPSEQYRSGASSGERSPRSFSEIGSERSPRSSSEIGSERDSGAEAVGENTHRQVEDSRNADHSSSFSINMENSPRHQNC